MFACKAENHFYSGIDTYLSKQSQTQKTVLAINKWTKYGKFHSDEEGKLYSLVAAPSRNHKSSLELAGEPVLPTVPSRQTSAPQK